MEKELQGALILDSIVFDEINFKRFGFKNDNELKLSFGAEIKKLDNSDDNYVTTIQISGDKKN